MPCNNQLSPNVNLYRFSLLLLALIMGPLTAYADSHAQISQLKATHYYKALKFTHWPDKHSPQKTMNIVLIGNDNVCSVLTQELPQRSILGHKVKLYALPSLQVNNWLNNDNARSILNQAHAIYFAINTQHDYPDILGILKHPVLTSSSIASFADHGGMIEIVFEEQQQKLTLHINTYNLQQSDMSVSSQLMKISTIIDPKS